MLELVPATKKSAVSKYCETALWSAQPRVLEARSVMSNGFQAALPSAIVQFLPSAESKRLEHYQRIYEANRHRVYSFAFWMTDSEMAAESISERTFLRVFSLSDDPSEEMVDRALLRELQCQESITLHPPQLQCAVVSEVSRVRRNTRRVDLERAIMQLPHTERMIFCMHDGDAYDHARIARTLDISEDESRQGLHQARLRIRELVNSANVGMAA
jgi:DNA-directed RNA polymerase specialized sigma24 family protein